MLKILTNGHNENESYCAATKICDDKTSKKKRNFSNNIPKHNIQRKRHKIPVGYRKTLLDDFRLTIVDQSAELAHEELKILLDYFGLSSEN